MPSIGHTPTSPVAARGSVRTSRVAAAALGALLLAGCGSGSPPAPLTLAHFVASANGVCSDTTQRESALGPPPLFRRATSANLQSAATYMDGFVTVLADASRRLHGLGHPDQQAALVDAMLARLDAGIGDFRAVARAAHNGDIMAFRTAYRAAVTADEDASALYEKIDLTSCTQLTTQPFRQSVPTQSASPGPADTPSPP